jgi:hypothetical protein
VDVLHKVFSTAAAVVSFFTDDAFDLGSLMSGSQLGDNTLTLTAKLSVRSQAASSGFYGDMIIGDPPQAAPASVHSFVQAAAAFGADAGGPLHSTPELARGTPPLLAAAHA